MENQSNDNNQDNTETEIAVSPDKMKAVLNLLFYIQGLRDGLDCSVYACADSASKLPRNDLRDQVFQGLTIAAPVAMEVWIEYVQLERSQDKFFGRYGLRKVIKISGSN